MNNQRKDLPNLYKALAGALGGQQSPPVEPSISPSMFQALQSQSSAQNAPLEPGVMIASNTAVPGALRQNMKKEFKTPEPALTQQPKVANINSDDYYAKAKKVMDAKEAQPRQEHPEWYR